MPQVQGEELPAEPPIQVEQCGITPQDPLRVLPKTSAASGRREWLAMAGVALRQSGWHPRHWTPSPRRAPPADADRARAGIVELTVDCPFLFLIRDKETGAFLFFGRVLDPTE